ncbi:two-component response regulator ARR10-like [Forsythia ovata]|uniref:Two-component response regulator ARR10-like n=1 Tax=Forsythia ovata TaxID=205694 RepID=A0ABD1X276_9LAMI
MQELRGFSINEGQRTSNASYLALIHDIHVLLVDHDSEGLISTTKMLELCSYKVTSVELASSGLSLLSSGHSHFDIIMANINSPDLHGFNLLQQAVDMDLPVILMSDEANAFLAMRALQNGAFLCMQKPAKMEMLTCLWQHVLREKKWIYKEKEREVAGIEIRGDFHEEHINAIGVDNMKNGDKLKKKIRGEKRKNEDEEYDLENPNKRIKRKSCIEWTHQLHGKFMDAIAQLGEGRCFPKEIQDLMNVPGLTRMQIASHLQKCRNHNWLGPQERKSLPTRTPSQEKARKFGSVPRLGKTSLPHFQIEENHEINHGNEFMPNDGGHGNRPIAPTLPSHQPRYEPFLSSSSNATPATNFSLNRRHQADDFYNFPDIDDLICNKN